MELNAFSIGKRIQVVEPSVAHYSACGTIVGFVYSARGDGTCWACVQLDGADPDIAFTEYSVEDIGLMEEMVTLMEREFGA